MISQNGSGSQWAQLRSNRSLLCGSRGRGEPSTMRMVLSPILKLWRLSAVGSKLLLFLSGDAAATLASEPEQSAGGSHFELSGDASAPLEREPYQKAPACTRMHQDAPRCTRMYQNAPGCTKMHQNAPGWIRMHQAAPGCTRMHQNAPGCTTMLKDAPAFTRVH